MDKARIKWIGVWVLQVLLALIFFKAAHAKLTGNPMMVGLFQKWGYPENFHLLIGTFELLGAVGLLIPRLAGYVACGLTVIMLGALTTHLLYHEAQAIVPAVLLVFLGLIIYARRPRFSPWRND